MLTLLGLKFSCYVRKKNNISKIVVGYDGRLSSELLNAELIQGLTDAGSYVTSIGCVHHLCFIMLIKFLGQMAL